MYKAPIPGASLTVEPGSVPWEQPAQFADPNDAMEDCFVRLTEPEHAHNICMLLESGVPVTLFVYTYLMSGFTEGKWSHDVAVLLIKPMIALIIRIAEVNDVKYDLGTDDEDGMKEFLNLTKLKNENPKPQKVIEVNQTPPTGLMTPMEE